MVVMAVSAAVIHAASLGKTIATIVVFAALVVMFARASERTAPRWLKPPRYWLQTREGRARLAARLRERRDDD
jgi:membrane protein implicated in regulation of membrane protease activity